MARFSISAAILVDRPGLDREADHFAAVRGSCSPDLKAVVAAILVVP